MKYLKIQNDGELDIRLVALMGGTTKSRDLFKIGQFGTGLKYTLAYLFRNNIDFKIFSGLSEIEINLDHEFIKDERFDIICINGNRTSITTKMGEDWQAWMIVRELYSNALDEGGAHYCITENVEAEPGKTSFYIELTVDFLQVYNDWSKYFIVGRMPMYENERFALHPTNGNLRLYKQGILIHESDRPALFNYDIKNAQINEMREYKGILSADMSRLIFSISDKNVIQYFLENLKREKRDKAELFESTIDLVFWENNSKMNAAWRETIGNAKIIHSEIKQKLISKQADIDLTHTIEVPQNLYKALTKSFDGIGALRMADKVNEFYEIHDADLELVLKEALTILEGCGYFIHPELTFTFGEFGCKTTLARIDIDKKDIMISQRMKDKSLFDFCAMLIEENEHYQTGYSDETREFQQHFIDLYTKTLFDKNAVKL